MGRNWKPPLSSPSPARAYLLLAFNDRDIFFQVRKELISQFGPIEYETEDYPAGHWLSSYGSSYRSLRILSFERLVKREELVDIRKRTLSIESRYQSKGLPTIELDPGYLSPYIVVRTALDEDFHRIYLYAGIYAESLLQFEKLSFRPFSHTQNYFCQKEIIAVFNDIRLIHLCDKL